MVNILDVTLLERNQQSLRLRRERGAENLDRSETLGLEHVHLHKCG